MKPLTVKDRNYLRDKLKVGDMVKFTEPVIYSNESNTTLKRGKSDSTGKILHKYPFLTLIECSEGRITTVTYTDLLLSQL